MDRTQPTPAQIVDVVIPVYRGLDQSRACIASVLGAPNRCGWELVLVDDAAPDPALGAYLDEVAEDPRVTLLRNPANLGFVGSVNRGMRLHPERDVVLLNSDTEVAGDWLDRLQRCAGQDSRIATVTPFSNNATICSFPQFCEDNQLPAGYSVEALDRLFREMNSGESIEIPTGVGFCMYIRRSALEALGLFDEEAFGRGYGEENDFCRRAAAAGWRSLLAADVFVYHEGSVSFAADRQALMAAGGAALLARHPDYDRVVREHVIADPAAPLRRRVEIELACRRRPQSGSSDDRDPGSSRAVLLHVMHDLGGGIARWCRDFCAAGGDCEQLILKPWSHSPAFGQGLLLFRAGDERHPLGFWPFERRFAATEVSHPEYRAVVDRIVAEYRVTTVIVSSLIGHALDILDSGLPTLVIQHDFYPACPAINAYFGEVCGECGDKRLARCTASNHDFNPFAGFELEQRQALRTRFTELVASPLVTLVSPTRSVEARLKRLVPGLQAASWVVIPHGLAAAPTAIDYEPGGRLRIVVLGMLAVSKGVRLIEAALERLRGLAEIHLIGAGEVAELFAGRPGIRLQARYEPGELDGILREIRPHLGLLASVCHESFSYTLSELQSAAIPPVATRVGSFAERIHDGDTGFLFDPDPDALVRLVGSLERDRPRLEAVHRRLRTLPSRSSAEMLRDYRRLLPLPAPRLRTTAGTGPEAPGGDAVASGLALELASQWRELRSTRLVVDLRGQRMARVAAEGEARLRSTGARLAAADETLAARARELAELRRQLDEMRASTSWRVSAPVRWLGRRLRQVRTVARAAAALASRPRLLRHALAALALGLSERGSAGLKHELWVLDRRPPPEPPAPPTAAGANPPTEALAELLSRRQAARRTLDEQLAALPRRPLISVIVPVFDPPEGVLLAMFDSVRGQIYPDWELCVADDGSTRPHVRRLLHRYAALDERIRISTGVPNGGVSRASNRALAMARGEFAVLLDHDDLLEEHALLRVAQSIVADDPDLVYSDEALVSEDGNRVLHLALRPAFSREYLRSHPYIVHLAGFRTALLRDLGGWDEGLRISQDYDLILRASEAARTIVHLPELLYRWRIHPQSAGHAKMDQVMTTSSRILQRHLERCGESGHVEPGPAFNFFQTRYTLDERPRVAIIVPTRNHHELVRACIDSVEATCTGVDHRIVLVDHASDQPEALAYFESLRGRVELLHVDGPFNFARLNNLAVASLAPGYSHYLFLNNDIEATDGGWLEAMLELAGASDVGAVGAKLYYPDRQTVQHAGVVVAACGIAENLGRFRRTDGPEPDQGYMGSLIANRELSAVTAACLLIRSTVFREVGGFDEALAVGYGDVDLCLRLRDLHYRVLLCAGARLIHHESRTRGPSDGASHPSDSLLFRERWAGYFETGDPYFNPSLSPSSPNWQIARPLEFDPRPARRVYRRLRGASARAVIEVRR